MTKPGDDTSGLRRRTFLATSAAAVGAVGTASVIEAAAAGQPVEAEPHAPAKRPYNGPYAGAHLNRVAFPLGGIGAGMMCLEGTGCLSHVSLRHKPDVFNEPCVFAALHVKGSPGMARVVEGPVPGWKLFGVKDAGNGRGGASYGLPRFRSASFLARFPFGTVTLADPKVPMRVELTGWSPFEPGDADGSSLPVAALEYAFTNTGDAAQEAVFSWNARNFLEVEKAKKAVRAVPGGFVLWSAGPEGAAWDEASFCVRVSDPAAKVNAAWFRGDWFDPLTLAWKDVAEGACYERAGRDGGRAGAGRDALRPLHPGARPDEDDRRPAVVVRGADEPRRRRVGCRWPEAAAAGTYRPWYSGRFGSIDEVAGFWSREYATLREKAARFSKCFHDTTLPAEAIEAVAANLAILKSPTVLRQADGRLWAWEGCGDSWGCCHGSCTHVWNYAQAVPHLFPSLERTLRETEFRVVAGRARAPDVPHRAAHPPDDARVPRRRRRPARRDPEGLPGMADQRRHGVAALDLAGRAHEPRLLHRGLGPAPPRRRRGAAPQHLRHRVLGRRRHVHELLPRRAARRRADGAGARRERAALRGAGRQGRARPRAGAVERRVLRAADRVEEPAREESAGDEELRRQLLPGGRSRSSSGRGRSTSTARAASPTASWAPGWRPCAASATSSTAPR